VLTRRAVISWRAEEALEVSGPTRPIGAGPTQHTAALLGLPQSTGVQRHPAVRTGQHSRAVGWTVMWKSTSAKRDHFVLIMFTFNSLI